MGPPSRSPPASPVPDPTPVPQARSGTSVAGAATPRPGWSRARAGEPAVADRVEAVRVIGADGDDGDSDADRGAARVPLTRPVPGAERPRPARLRDAAVAAARPQVLEGLGPLLDGLWEAALQAGGVAVRSPDVHRLVRRCQPHLAHVYACGLEDGAALADADADPDAADPLRTVAAARTFGAAVASAFDAAARVLGASSAGSGVPDGCGAEMPDGARDAFEEVTGYRLAVLVDRHLARAYGYGVYDAWLRIGVAGKTWIELDETDCPEGRCRMNALRGSVALTEGFPSGDLVPPAHVACTCVLESA